jgi:hypothetical protein
MNRGWVDRHALVGHVSTPSFPKGSETFHANHAFRDQAQTRVWGWEYHLKEYEITEACYEHWVGLLSFCPAIHASRHSNHFGCESQTFATAERVARRRFSEPPS